MSTDSIEAHPVVKSLTETHSPAEGRTLINRSSKTFSRLATQYTGSERLVESLFSPLVFAVLVWLWLIILALMADGQQHMDFGVTIQAYSVLAAISQFVSTVFCAYYWGKLRGNVTHPQKKDILLLSTASAVLFFKLAQDVYFINMYDRLYDTSQTVVDTFAQRQFDSLFNLINVSTVTLVPCLSYFIAVNSPWPAVDPNNKGAQNPAGVKNVADVINDNSHQL